MTEATPQPDVTYGTIRGRLDRLAAAVAAIDTEHDDRAAATAAARDARLRGDDDDGAAGAQIPNHPVPPTRPGRSGLSEVPASH